MYAQATPQELSQGDILANVSLVDSASPTSPPTEKTVIVLSHDCEIDKKSNKVVIVAGVRTMQELEQSFPGIKGDLQKGRVYGAMYLSPHGPLGESCVDFRYIFRVSKKHLEESIKQGSRILSLNDEGKQALSIFFERYLFRNIDIPRA